MKEKHDPKELARTVNEGRRIEAFFASPDWLEIIEPKIAREQADADAMVRWKPGMAVDNDEKYRAYYSGASDGIGWFVSVLKRAVKDGKEAAEILSAQEGK